ARAAKWRDEAEKDLSRCRAAHQEDLARLDKLIAQHGAELDFALKSLARLRQIGNVITAEEIDLAEKKCEVHRAEGEQARAMKKAGEAVGTQEAEAERARREREWADAQSALTLLEAGTRPEEIDAERARLARLREEVRYLRELQGKVQVSSPCAGVVMTPR